MGSHCVQKLWPNILTRTKSSKIFQFMYRSIEAAQKRKDALDHFLLYGPPGLCKTTLSMIILNQLGVNIRITSGYAIQRPGDLAALFSNLNENDALFIDEIHRLARRAEEILYSAMEDEAIDVRLKKGLSARLICPDLLGFTFTGATIEDVYEPFLMRRGFLYRTPRGRCVEPKAYEYFEIEQVCQRVNSIML